MSIASGPASELRNWPKCWSEVSIDDNTDPPDRPRNAYTPLTGRRLRCVASEHPALARQAAPRSRRGGLRCGRSGSEARNDTRDTAAASAETRERRPPPQPPQPRASDPSVHRRPKEARCRSSPRACSRSAACKRPSRPDKDAAPKGRRQGEEGRHLQALEVRRRVQAAGERCYSARREAKKANSIYVPPEAKLALLLELEYHRHVAEGEEDPGY